MKYSAKFYNTSQKTPPEDLPQHTDNQIANLQQRIQCTIAPTTNETHCHSHVKIL